MPLPQPQFTEDITTIASSETIFPAGQEGASSCQLAGPAAGEKPPVSFCFSVPHVQQAFNWDCGLACVLMALKAFNLSHYDMAALRTLCPNQSIWTIDLAHLLRQCGVAVTFYTVYLGANPSYAGEHFYAEHIVEDEARVARLFEEAPGACIKVLQRSMQLDELQSRLLTGRHLVIALVDKRRLQQGIRPVGNPAAQQAAYIGHYILICGYDTQSDAFTITDPALPLCSQPMSVPSLVLDAARRSFGTDEDLLLLQIPGLLGQE